MIVYRIVNMNNGMTYVGQTTKSMKTRWAEHCKKNSGCRWLKHAINKYGKKSFSVEMLNKYQTIEQLNDAEEYFIGFYNCLAPNGYNLETGGNNYIRTSEARAYLSARLKGKNKGSTPWNKGTKGIVKAWNKDKKGAINSGSFKKGHSQSSESKQKMSLAKIGKPNWKKGLKSERINGKISYVNKLIA